MAIDVEELSNPPFYILRDHVYIYIYIYIYICVCVCVYTVVQTLT